MSTLTQTREIVMMNLRSIPDRLAPSLVIVIGIAGVVGVLVALLSMSSGLKQTLGGSGRDDMAVITRGGSQGELSSFLTIAAMTLIKQDRAIARGADGLPLASGELIVITEVPRPGQSTGANVTLRGVESVGFALRPDFVMVEGRRFRPGVQEIIVGDGAAQQFEGLAIGNQLRFRGGTWTIVGHFRSGDAYDSELWTDRETLQGAFGRAGVSSLLVQLRGTNDLDPMKDRLTADPQLDVDVRTQRDYYTGQSAGLTSVIGWLAGVVATIIKVDDGLGGKVSKLVLTANQTGESSRISISVADDDGNDTDGSGLSRLSSAQLVDGSPPNLDALIEVDGQPVTSATNVLADTIEGVTLTLVSADPGNPVTITASEDRSVAVDRIKAFVETFNTTMTTFGDATLVGPEGGQNGALLGDATARLIEGRLRNAIGDRMTSVNSAYSSLASIGVTTSDTGALVLDEEKLAAAMAGDYEGVVAIFTASEDGVAGKLRQSLTPYLQFDGLLKSRNESLSGQIADIDERRSRLSTRESALEARYLAQFSAMDALVASLQATGDFLTRQIDALTASRK